MSVRSGIEDWLYKNYKSSHDSTNESHRDRSDYCNLNIATFTFGGKHDNSHEDRDNNTPSSSNFNSFKKNQTNKRIRETFGPEDYMAIINTPANNLNHNSFLNVIIHALWNMKHFKNYILNIYFEKDTKYQLIACLKSTLAKYTINKLPDVSELRITLADIFQKRRKFLLEQPDDPIDCYYALINCIHSYCIKSSLNEFKDSNCNNKCIAHKYFWIDLNRVDECECRKSSKRMFSYHNYVFDIPLDKLFELTNMNLIEMTKSFKLKGGKITNEVSSVGDLKGKLFLYFKKLLDCNRMACSEGRCEINKTNSKFIIANNPHYLVFSLQKNGYNSILDILNTFILIPKIFDLATMFEHSGRQKLFYELVGVIMIKPSKTYTSCFKKDEQWIYHDEEESRLFSSWFEFITHCLKNAESPFMLFFNLQDKYLNFDKDLSNDEIHILERYARNADDLSNICQNKFRINEDYLRFDNIELIKPSNSKNSTSISTSKNHSNNNSNSRSDFGEYVCPFCLSKNRIENPLCYKCSKNNEGVIEDLLKRKQLNNYINIANFNLNINTDDVNRIKSESKEKSSSLKRKTNYKDESEEDSKNYNMPKQIKAKEEEATRISIKKNSEKVISPERTKPHSASLKREIKITTEDRIRPFEGPKIKKKDEDTWICIYCSYSNKNKDTKCLSCKRLNKKEEANETRVLTKNTSTPSLQKKPSEKKINVANYYSENNKNDVKKTCICYTNYDETFIRNNICRFCNRYIEKTHTHENSIKRTTQHETVKPRNTMKAEKPTILVEKKEDKLYRSPSTNTKSKITSQRYVAEEDIYPVQNPFSQPKIMEREKSQSKLNTSRKKIDITPISSRYKK